MKTVIIERFKITNNYSLGHCYVEHSPGNIEYIGASLERGWRNNEKNISCIPEGTYPLKLEYSPKFKKDLWELYDVPNRSEIKFHVANYWKELNGCIALGNKHKDINNDGDPDVTSSRLTMKKFHEVMNGLSQAKVIIKNINSDY